MLKGISQSTSIGDFVLNDGGKRKKLLNEMLARLADASNNFTIGQYQPGILECYPCIRLSPSSEYTHPSLYTCTVGHTTIHFGAWGLFTPSCPSNGLTS